MSRPYVGVVDIVPGSEKKPPRCIIASLSYATHYTVLRVRFLRGEVWGNIKWGLNLVISIHFTKFV